MDGYQKEVYSGCLIFLNEVNGELKGLDIYKHTINQNITVPICECNGLLSLIMRSNETVSGQKETEEKQENKRKEQDDLDGVSVDTKPPTWQLHVCG